MSASVPVDPPPPAGGEPSRPGSGGGPGRSEGRSGGRSEGQGRRRGRRPRDVARSDARGDVRGRAAGPQQPRGRRPEDDARAEARRARAAEHRAAVDLGTIAFPEDLPVSARREEIAAAIRDHQVVVVAGETGSGKTTQLPKIALELGRGRAGQIGHTQPRRIAARSVAERIAEELGGRIGGVVGYQVRFTDESSEDTLVKVMTDGILLAQIQRDPMLRQYDTLIVDEAHERSLNIDFILGYLTRLLPRRPDLKLIITSATIDSARFARHFGTPVDPATGLAGLTEAERARVDPEHPDVLPAPVVEVTGRTYPVEVRYRPLSPDRTGVEDEDDELFVDEDDRAPATAARAARGGSARTGRASGAAAAARGADKDLVTGIVEAVEELLVDSPGDVLVFLSGEREIRDAEDALRTALGTRVTDPRHPRPVELLPLYSRLSAAEQHRVFEAHTARRVVLATNVAETSLTVPGITSVVDPGTARISRYSKATKVQRLPIEPISRASANQRSGRSGRLSPGVAIRLYSEEDYLSRPEFTEPEILRTSLASVVLQMIAVGVVASPDEVVDFPFVDPPDVRSVRDGVALLTELGALAAEDGRLRLTSTGQALAQLPIDPRLARMIVEAGRRGVAREVAVIAAALSIQDPRERPADQREQADALHRRFADPSSDLLTYLNLWTWLREQRRALSGSAFRRQVRAEHLNYLRLREWQDVVTQLRDLTAPLGIDAKGAPRPTDRGVVDAPGDAAGRRNGAERGPGDRRVAGDTPSGTGAADALRTEAPPADAPADAEALEADRTRWGWDGDRIHQAVLSGLLSQIGMQEATEVQATTKGRGDRGRDAARGARPDRRARNEYIGARGARFAIFPGSGLARRPPAWVMAAELVETSRLWARDAARIQPEWAEELAAHLVRRTYSEPAWSTRQGAAMVTEKVLLYGVPIVADRRVLYSKVDPGHARELFLRHALVQGEWTTPHRFFHENRRLLAEAEQLEARARRRDLVVDDDVLFDFYDERVPDDVVSAAHFDRWWKGARRADPDLLTFTRELLVGEGHGVDERAFPSRWPQGDLSLPLTYQFEPGTEADGVTVHVPLVTLARLRPEGFDWMVPGLRADLVTATIRALPKPVRVQLVPAPDVARLVDAWMHEHLASWEATVRAGDAAPSFREAFAQAVRAVRGVDVDPADVDEDRLPAHLRMTFRVVGDRGGVLDEGKDLLVLQRRLAGRAQDAVSSAVRTAVQAAMAEAQAAAGGGPAGPGAGPRADGEVRARGRGGRRDGSPAPRPGPGAAPAAPPSPPLERSGLTTWPDLPGGTLPDVVETTVGGVPVRAYPSLVEEGTGAGATAAVRTLADAAARPTASRRGLRRLLLADVGLPSGRVTSRWTGTQALALAASPYPSTDALVADVQLAAIDALVARHLAPAAGAAAPGSVPAERVRTAEDYAAVRAAVRAGLEDAVHGLVGHLVAVLTAWRELEAAVRGTTSLALLATVQDVREQAAALVHPGFVVETGADRLPQLTRYLRAARLRLEKAADSPQRDADLAWQVRDVTEAYRAAVTRAAAAPPDVARDAALEAVRWQLEELRVSLFAQTLGVPVPVSTTRIRKALATLP